MDVSEIDRIEEQERHNELMDMLDNVDFSDVLEDQTPSLVSLEHAAPMHAQQANGQFARSVPATYGTSEYAAKVVELADSSIEAGELRGVLQELHTASAKNRALAMQLEHLKLQYEGIQAENEQLHGRCEEATAARESAEEQLLLVQAKLQQISAFEASAGVRTDSSLEALRGQLLHHAREEIADLKMEIHTLRMEQDRKTKQFDELLQRYDTETKGLRAEMQKLANDLAQRTVLYASKEREWRIQLSQTERMNVDQNAQLIGLEATNKELQKQVERLEGQRMNEATKSKQLARQITQLEEELAGLREAEQQLADENAELQAQLVGVQNEVEHLRRGGVEDLQRNMVHEVEHLRTAHDREVKKLQSELDQAVEAYKAEHERSVQYEHEWAKYKELAEQSERALSDMIRGAASTDVVLAQLLERSGRHGLSGFDQHDLGQSSASARTVPVDTKNSSTQTDVDYERVIRGLENEVLQSKQQVAALQKQIKEHRTVDQRLEAHQVQLEVKYRTAMQADLARLRAELEADYAARKEQLDKARQSTLTESKILHEEIRALREENHALRVDYDDIKQQQQDASQIAEMIAAQRIEELQEKHAAALDKLHQHWHSVLQGFASYAANRDASALTASTIRERLAEITNSSARSQAYSLLERLGEMRDELARRSNPVADKKVVAECTAKVRVDLLRVMEPVMQMLLSHLSAREETLMRKVGALDMRLQRCYRNVARVKSQRPVQRPVQRKQDDSQQARRMVERLVRGCQEQMLQKIQAIAWRVDRNQQKVQQLQSTMSTAQAMVLAGTEIAEATQRTLQSRNKQLQYTIQQLEHELQVQGGAVEADSLDLRALQAMARRQQRPDPHMMQVVRHLYAQVQELRSRLQLMSTTTEADMKVLYNQCADQVRVVALKYQSALSGHSPLHSPIAQRSPPRTRHARSESPPSPTQVQEIIEREQKRLSQEFEAKQASIISHWKEEMRLAVARIKAQAEADAQREYSTKSEQQRIAHRAQLERALADKEQEFTRRVAKLNADWQARFADLEAHTTGAEEMRVHLQQQLANERARLQENKQREVERIRHDVKAEMKARYKAKVVQLKQRFEAERDAILEMVRQECETLLQEAKFAVARRKQKAQPEETPQLYPEMLSPAQTQALLDSIVRRSNQNFEKTGRYAEHADHPESSEQTPYSRTAPVVTPSTTSTLGSSAHHHRRRPRTTGTNRIH